MVAPEARREAAWSLQLHDSPHAIDAGAWDALLASSPEPTPFLRHAFLAALHDSGSAVERSGWTPRFATLHAEGEALPQAACALYLKTHSYGEYVFDWAWAEAYERAGQPYYPKLLGAVPFTPVPGSRLLATSESARHALALGITQLARQMELSSAHLLFTDAADRDALLAAGWLERSSVQFHWQNRVPAPYADFNEFLAGLSRDKRRKIAQERRHVSSAGVVFETLAGASIDKADWDFFHRCYSATYRAHHSTPYLTRAFFTQVATSMAEHLVLFVARRDGRPIACSLIVVDPASRVAWGRYWGATEYVNCLHFEACYYQPLAWCIAHGYSRFEGGAQGEHKMARGLMPVRTRSLHWLAQPAFFDAVARYLEREGAGIEAYVDELEQRSPFRAAPP
ncbi:GNAT family N-acetyltransferase [Rivibacter subsaxonicus]|uniref:N-acetyltransferase n=1 Tax=Rivibacter subsaxonicus TaxID=457575 RepID=A0A4Q7W1D0_9BURK|nr:GNAT family N-acetyltransferase [Rivibacter subsaxonicus]RZU03074.1 hypothetical protein EV670_1107 [Rivibacter subsaxonicus]